MKSVKNNMQILFLLLLLSCHRDIINPVQTGQPSTFNEVFENFWIQMNTNYLYWSKDSTNWDKIYQKYKPVFQNLDINNNEDLKKSLNLFVQPENKRLQAPCPVFFLSAHNQKPYPVLRSKNTAIYTTNSR